MLSFTCPECYKHLRAAEVKAGAIIKCPGCGITFAIPGGRPKPEPRKEEKAEQLDKDEEEEEKLTPRKKRRDAAKAAAARGKTLVIVIASVVLALHLLRWIQFFSGGAAGITEAANQQAEKMNAGQAGASQQPVDPQMLARVAKSVSIGFLFGSLLLDAILLFFLYLHHNWARIVLAILFLIGTLCGLVGLVPLFTTLRVVTRGQAALAVAGAILGLAINVGFGITLLVSGNIKAYTAAR
jgi:hypothetical protein